MAGTESEEEEVEALPQVDGGNSDITWFREACDEDFDDDEGDRHSDASEDDGGKTASSAKGKSEAAELARRILAQHRSDKVGVRKPRTKSALVELLRTSSFLEEGKEYESKYELLLEEAEYNEALQKKIKRLDSTAQDVASQCCFETGCEYAFVAHFQAATRKWKLKKFKPHTCDATSTRPERIATTKRKDGKSQGEHKCAYSAAQLAPCVEDIVRKGRDNLKRSLLRQELDKYVWVKPADSFVDRVRQAALDSIFGSVKDAEV